MEKFNCQCCGKEVTNPDKACPYEELCLDCYIELQQDRSARASDANYRPSKAECDAHEYEMYGTVGGKVYR